VPLTLSPDAVALDCGHLPTVDGFSFTTGYGTDPTTGRRSCFDCANRQEAEAFAASHRYVAYVDSAGNLTTWPGGILARGILSAHGVSRSGWHGSEVHSWRFRAEDGSEWYGRNGGPGMVISVRRAKR
jgi:hypothetical protein